MSSTDNTSTPTDMVADDTALGVQFLLAEYDNVRQFKESSVAIADKRLDIFMALSSALVGGLVLLSQTHPMDFTIISFIGVLGLLGLGLTTFRQVLDRDILIVDYIRTINRIRAYFVEHAPSIKDYILMPISHEYPAYKWTSSNRSTLIMINAFCVAVLSVLGWLLINNTAQPDAIALSLAILSFGASYFLQRKYSNDVFKHAEDVAAKNRTVSLFASHQVVRTAQIEKDRQDQREDG